MKNLTDDVRYWCTKTSEKTPIEQAARIHHQLVFIHPYLNGNGRFSRLVADRYLKAWKCQFPKWPSDLGESGYHRHSYIAALKNADIGDYGPLISYMIEKGAKEPLVL